MVRPVPVLPDPPPGRPLAKKVTGKNVVMTKSADKRQDRIDAMKLALKMNKKGK